MSVDRLQLVGASSIALVIAGKGSTGVDALDRLVTDLLSSNTRQWELEDVSRGEAPDTDVAESKRAIDATNMHRVRRLVDLDELLQPLVRDPTAAPATETPGSVIDRLTIMSIRLERFERLEVDGGEPDLRGQTVRDQYDRLLAALDVLFADLRSGRRSYLATPQTKLYGPTRTKESY